METSYSTNLIEREAPTDYYWAKAPTDEIVRHLSSKRERFFRWLEGSTLVSRVLKLWQYYHGLFNSTVRFDAVAGPDIIVENSNDETVMMSVNHLRSILSLIATYITQGQIAWDCIAANADQRSLHQARLGNDVLDDYWTRHRLAQRMRRAVEHSLVLTVGFARCNWDPTRGRETGNTFKRYDEQGNISGGYVEREGDFFFDNPTILGDIVYDHSMRDWDPEWIKVRRSVNKWTEAALYPEYEEEILQASAARSHGHLHWLNGFYDSPRGASDRVDKWDFYHLPTPALPLGRHVCYIGDQVLNDEDYDEEHLPVVRMVPAEMLLTTFGHSPGLDLIDIQELFNAELSTIATGHNALGQQKIWMRAGEAINQADLEPGVSVIQTDTKPEPLNLLSSPKEIFEMLPLCVGQMEYSSSMNAVARGQPQKSLESGTALAMIDQKALQAQTPLQEAYYQLHEEFGTLLIQGLKKNAEAPRIVAIVGVQNRSKLKEFTREDLSSIDRVQVVTGSPFLRNLPGRVQFAEMLIQANLVKEKEELLTLIDTGQIEPLTRHNTAELSVIHEENEALLDGAILEALIVDNHILHILEHKSLLDSIELRNNPLLLEAILGHIDDHIEKLMDPMSQLLMAVFGYPSPLQLGAPGGAPAPGPDRGGGQENQERKPPPTKKEQAIKKAENQAPPEMNNQARGLMTKALAGSEAI